MRRYFLSLLLLMLAGCGDGKVHLPTSPVSGTVTYRAKPLGNGRIIFFHPTGQAAASDIASDGTFALAAFQGNNQVVIEWREPDVPNPNPGGRPPILPGKSLVPERYLNPQTSGLTFEVKPDENEKAEFVLID
jgi:hypothetical protein